MTSSASVGSSIASSSSLGSSSGRLDRSAAICNQEILYSLWDEMFTLSEFCGQLWHLKLATGGTTEGDEQQMLINSSCSVPWHSFLENQVGTLTVRTNYCRPTLTPQTHSS